MNLWIRIILSFMIFFLSIVIAIDILVIGNTKEKIYNVDELNEINDIDAILVLGAGIKNNKPSLMLQERLDQAITLYESKVADKIIVSGDHGQINYDEVNVMKTYLIDHDIPSKDIFMDHAGFNTYDSMYRAKYIFDVKKMVVVTQEYHLYRALYIANSLGIDAYGSNATRKIYAGQKYRDVREILARIKDYFLSIAKPKSKYLGDPIDLNLTGNVTNDYYIYIASQLAHESEHYIFDRDTYDEIVQLTTKDRNLKKCGLTSKYTMILNGSTIYELEVLDDTIHIVDGKNEISLTKEESKIIFDILAS